MEAHKETVKKRIERIELLLPILKKAISGKDIGSLTVKKIRGAPRYYLRNNGKEQRYLGIDEIGLIKSLAQKGYTEDVLKAAQAELKYLRNFVTRYPTTPEEVYRQLDDVRKALVDPVIMDDELYAKRWIEKPYKRRVIDDKIPTFKTANGEMVISKSEKIIADSLFRMGIPYKYDCPLTLIDEEGQTIIKYPDFTTLNIKRRKIFYVEHLGMMDDIDYVNRNVHKVELYERNGIYPGDKLILIHETDARPLDVEVMEDMLKRFLLE